MWTFIELFWAEFKTKTLGNINHSSINYWLGGWIVLPYIDCLPYISYGQSRRKGNNMKRERRQRQFGKTGTLFFYQSPQSYRPFLPFKLFWFIVFAFHSLCWCIFISALLLAFGSYFTEVHSPLDASSHPSVGDWVFIHKPMWTS